MSKEEQALATKQDQQQISDDLAEMIQHVRSLPPQIVKLQSATKSWDFGDDVYEKKIHGTIVSDFRPRTWWERDVSEGDTGSRPDCYSADALTPNADSPKKQSDTCPTCQWSKFGSHRNGRGQACQQKGIVIVIQPGAILPIALRLPPTSTGALDKLYQTLLRKGKSYSKVVTEFTLVEEKNKQGIAYAKLVAKELRDTTPEEDAIVNALRQYVPHFKQVLTGGTQAAAQLTAGPRDAQEPAIVEGDDSFQFEK